MAKYVIDSTTLTAIADSIRTKKGTTANITPQNMPSEIAGITTGENLDVVLTEQEALIEELKEVLRGKASGGGDSEFTLDKFVEGGYFTELTLPTATKIKNSAFINETKLLKITMPKVTSIGRNAFNACSKLVLDTFPSGLKSIDASAFSFCTSLTTLVFPSGFTTLDSTAFSNCSNILSVTFEGTPKSIANTAFSNCTKIKTINVPWAEGAVKNAPWGATKATINYNYTGE